MVMELLSGDDLKHRLRAGGPLPLAETLRILGSLCKTLDFAHSRGVIHRDIKPSNVFLSTDGASPRVTVLDFGLAKLIDDPGQSLTASRQILGTPTSMAPEQILGGAVDRRSDIYALGALAFHLLAGEPPFRSDSVHVLCQMHLHARVPNLSASAQVSPALDHVIARAMSKQREHRYPSCGEFLAALESASRLGQHDIAPAAKREASIVALAVGVHTADETSSDSDGMRRDFDAILPLAREILEQASMKVGFRAGDFLLAFAELGTDGETARAERERAIQVALDLKRCLSARAEQHVSVVATIAALSGSATLQGPTLLASPLLNRARSAVAHVSERVLTTADTLVGLERAADPAAFDAEFLLLAAADA
jgi:serine/threonine-protein kinase